MCKTLSEKADKLPIGRRDSAHKPVHQLKMSSRTTTLKPLQVASDSTPQTLRIHRVYPLGETCQFDTSLGSQSVIVHTEDAENVQNYEDSLLGKAGVAQRDLDAVLHEMNQQLAAIDVPSWHSFFEIVFGCLTCYVFGLEKRTKLRRGLENIRSFVKLKNAEIFNPKGVNLTDPKETAWLFLEFEPL